MSGFGGRTGLAGGRRKREVIEVPEPKSEDRSLDKLLHVRKLRIDTLERERIAAKEAWRATRGALREAKERARTVQREASEFWADARARFFEMATTSGDVRRAKATYERMKSQALELRLACGEYVGRCKAAGDEYFEARKRARDAAMQQEKLKILRDEIRQLSKQNEA